MVELKPDDGQPLVGKYKWLGGAVARDGNVYCVPSDSTQILKIEAATNRVIVFGRLYTNPSASYVFPRALILRPRTLETLNPEGTTSRVRARMHDQIS